MIKTILGVALLTTTLTACEHTHSWAQTFSFMQPIKKEASQYDFNWRLSGDREVAPLQVFSANNQLWLQFAVEQNIPAIFALENGRHIPLSYKRSDPYIIVSGAWQHLLFRGAALQAQAHYSPPALSSALQSPITEQPDAVASVSVVDAMPPPSSLKADGVDDVTLTDTGSLPTHSQPVAAFAVAEIPFSVAPNDGTIRQALKRWAQRDGWVFLDQHWEVEVDFPIVSSALFSAEFNDAVTQLMRSTALGSRPLQACLYSNKVMRVIPLAQQCDPTAVLSHTS
ncbi:TcpQ domain-containing protein [uncultured Paenalcaligenes sp.]|uniref:TcpQ domain-containing protein n=1 Tax=uncultured Paenalcaligenes sp. TaxID=1588925 RepID=UPI002621C41A|nr:TcpQ domain-containing protein [uncultured Paenalcaligenes sp.]